MSWNEGAFIVQGMMHLGVSKLTTEELNTRARTQHRREHENDDEATAIQLSGGNLNFPPRASREKKITWQDLMRK